MVRRVGALGGGRENRRDMGVAHLQVHTTNLDNAIILWVVGLVGVCGVAGQATTTTPSGTTTVAYAIGDGPPPLSANCTGNSVTAEGILQGTRRYASISVRYDTTAVVNVTWTVSRPTPAYTCPRIVHRHAATVCTVHVFNPVSESNPTSSQTV